jgi:hypothetical protein
MVRASADRVALWPAFFLICFGLGYATLNRYDPSRLEGTSDSRQYSTVVVDGPGAADEHWRSRILVPFLAKPIYRLAVGRVGSWNPAALALLVVNSAFCATAAWLLILLAEAFDLPFAIGLVAAFAWLLNFIVTNFLLAGMVDSAEAMLMIAVLFALQRQSWIWLPILGAIGGLAKETFVPLAVLVACGWIWNGPRKRWLSVAGMGVAGIAVVVIVRSTIAGGLVTPFHIASDERGLQGFSDIPRAVAEFAGSGLTWITFLWLVPPAVLGRSRLPTHAWRATALGVMGALALIVWHDAGGNAARPLFDVAGPMLCLAFAIGTTERLR